MSIAMMWILELMCINVRKMRLEMNTIVILLEGRVGTWPEL